jgi:signal transduction histidine kinase
VDKNQAIEFPANQVDEFTFMDETLQKATNQARHDYVILKEFTENASHEMQTPLAIIRSKLDLFIQNENLSEDQSKTMQSAYLAVERLSRLNHSLLLLAKIGNNQYAETSPINLKQKLEEKIDAFHELWQSQNISVTTSLTDATVNMNQELGDILLNNLLSNATRHNFTGGLINIDLTGKQLKITNSSLYKDLGNPYLFSRFYKQDGKGNNGLGLSIIKEICDISGLEIHYLFEDDSHSFILSLS